MRPLRARLEMARNELGVPWHVLERDYVLSWVLAGITRSDILQPTLVFKGGTCLKKCYFGAYRFSEDLDFSALPGAPSGEAMMRAMASACDVASTLLEEFAPVEITCERYTERDPHPGGQEAFTLRARLPWQRELQTRVMVEITTDEPVLRDPVVRQVIHGYGEAYDTAIQAYALEEVVAEKLRAILQHVEHVERRGWSRSRARDYYDLWRILGEHRTALDLSSFSELLNRKCEVRGVSFDVVDDFFRPVILEQVERTWDQWLGQLVPDLPGYQRVVGELRPMIAEILNDGS